MELSCWYTDACDGSDEDGNGSVHHGFKGGRGPSIIIMPKLPDPGASEITGERFVDQRCDLFTRTRGCGCDCSCSGGDCGCELGIVRERCGRSMMALCMMSVQYEV